MGEEQGGGVGGFLKEAAIVVIGALILSTLLRLFLVQVFLIPSRSMEPTLAVGDRVAVQKVSGFTRGDIVVFRDDLEWLGNPDRFSQPIWKDVLTFVGLMPDESNNHLVKRLIGLEGDHVVCCDTEGRLTVNDAALEESAYLAVDPTTGRQVKPSEHTFDLVVPAGRIFVMGDNRSNSADSRCHLAEDDGGVDHLGAFPSTGSVVGVVAATIFPFDRWRGFGAPDSFAEVPSASAPAPAEPVLSGTVPAC